MPAFLEELPCLVEVEQRLCLSFSEGCRGEATVARSSVCVKSEFRNADRSRLTEQTPALKIRTRQIRSLSTGALAQCSSPMPEWREVYRGSREQVPIPKSRIAVACP